MAKLKGKNKAKARQQELKVKLYQHNLYKREMRKLIKTFDDSVLKIKCDTVSSLDEIKDTISQLTKILLSTDDGVGIAAPQIGHSKCVFVARNDVISKNVKCYINPEIVSFNGKEVEVHEGCLSYPKIYANIKRNNSITVKYFDENFKEQKELLKDKEAFIFQHENDHLFGVCKVGEYYDINKLPSKAGNNIEAIRLREAQAIARGDFDKAISLTYEEEEELEKQQKENK